jgi:predicted nucleic acid-binding protein
MQVLLDTNVLIHREARTVVREDIGLLFRWLDRLKHQKLVHPVSLDEIKKHADPGVVDTLTKKLGSYEVFKTLSADTAGIALIRREDVTENARNDTSLLAEVAAERVDLLITEDRGIHRKADRLGLSARVFTIDSFLEKVTAENPEWADYKVLSARKRLFGEINLADPFFDSFREDYPDFDRWFKRKADETAYVCTAPDGSLLAFLYLKREGPEDNYGDITPPFAKASRIKIGTMKVVANGFKLGERFLKIVFDNALQYGVDEIYVTLFRRTSDHDKLALLLDDWGFRQHGTKAASGGRHELVYVRPFRRAVNTTDPRVTYPFVAGATRKFIVPIYPEYHTELLPDSILRTESPADFVEDRPNRNAISKVYISRSYERDLKRGDLIVFYRTKSDQAPAFYTSVATTLGVVMDVTTNIKTKAAFIEACRKRSVFTDAELGKFWDYSPGNRPFVVSFLYVHSFPHRPNLKELQALGIIKEAPRGFVRLQDDAFTALLKAAKADGRLVVDQA